MKTLIAYATRYGTSERCARSLAESLEGEVELLNLRSGRPADGSRPNLEQYDSIIIGGPIYGGQIMRKVPAFCEKHRSVLERKHIGLFICCLYDGEKAAAELRASFPPWLSAHSVGSYAFGGAVTVKRLHFMDRFLMRRVAQSTHDLDTVKSDLIVQLAKDVVRSTKG